MCANTKVRGLSYTVGVGDANLHFTLVSKGPFTLSVGDPEQFGVATHFAVSHNKSFSS